MTIAQRIRNRRLKQGIRQNDLAVLSGLTQSQISRYEAGVNSPAIPILRVLAQALDTTIEYLLGSTEDQSPRTADLTPEETALVDAVRARDVARIFRVLALIFEGDSNETDSGTSSPFADRNDDLRAGIKVLVEKDDEPKTSLPR